MCIALSNLETAIFAIWFILLVWLTVSGVRKDMRKMPLWKKIVYHTLAVGVDSPGNTIGSACRANLLYLLRLLRVLALIAIVIFGLWLLFTHTII